MVCDMLHRLIYIIIIGGLCWPVHRPGVAVVSGMRWRRFGRCDALQRVAGGTMAAFVCPVSVAAERVQSQEKPL